MQADVVQRLDGAGALVNTLVIFESFIIDYLLSSLSYRGISNA